MSNTRRILLCNCSRTLPLDGKRLSHVLQRDEPLDVATELCRKQIARFEEAMKRGDDLLVACTQEASLFGELHAERECRSDIRFVNVREFAGWSDEGKDALPKMTALLALAQMPEPEPVPVVSYRSEGQLLIIGDANVAIAWAERLKAHLGISVLINGSGGAGKLPTDRSYPIYSGTDVKVAGYLGAFQVSWQQSNPIDLEVCTRCNACVKACPEHAIDYRYQIDLGKCRAHRACVAACGELNAIDFERPEAREARADRYDLVLDLSREPLIKFHELPQGYLAPGDDALQQALAAAELARLTGEFEKPKFFEYKEKTCAHSRSRIVGCTQCVDVCSTGAITSNIEQNRVDIEPHLCMGCGGCATVCPSGAITYAYPRVADIGSRIRTALKTYRAAGGKNAALLFHNASDGRELLLRLGREGRGLPARVVPLEMNHIGAFGMDLMLGSLALGAAQVIILSTGTEAPEYLAALREQLAHASEILATLAYGNDRLHLLVHDEVRGVEEAIWSLAASSDLPAATFDLFNEKRTTLDFVFDHLVKHARRPVEEIPLKRGAPYGRVAVNAERCTLCMSCVGACPEGALLDTKDRPQLKFIERSCVQCALCERSCPEDAITLHPRLLLAKQAREPVLLNEAEPFACVRCGKPFGTRQMVEKLLARLTGHAMYGSRVSLERMKMCADCRVIDMLQNTEEVNILDVEPQDDKSGRLP